MRDSILVRMKKRAVSLAAWTVTVLSLLALAVSLIDVRLAPAQPLPADVKTSVSIGARSPVGSFDFGLLLRIGLILLIAALALHVIVSLASRAGRRRLLADAAAFALLALALGLLSRLSPSPTAGRMDEEAAPIGPGATAAEDAAPRLREPPPAWLTWATGAGLVIASVAALAGIIVMVARLKRRSAGAGERASVEARAAVRSIRAGEDLRGVVIRCYARMQDIVEEERGIRRKRTETPREFLAELESAGLPPDALRDLTRVFEEVCYGRAGPGPETERRAIESLSRIAAACGADA